MYTLYYIINTTVYILSTMLSTLLYIYSLLYYQYCFIYSVYVLFAPLPMQDKKSAVMCSQSLIDKVPVGVEKILVAKLCIDLTRSWLSSLQQVLLGLLLQ